MNKQELVKQGVEVTEAEAECLARGYHDWDPNHVDEIVDDEFTVEICLTCKDCGAVCCCYGEWESAG